MEQDLRAAAPAGTRPAPQALSHASRTLVALGAVGARPGVASVAFGRDNAPKALQQLRISQRLGALPLQPAKLRQVAATSSN